MLNFALAVLAVFGLLVASEFWWRRRPHHPELARKFIHITVGSFVAFWPFFLSWDEIKILSLAFLAVVLISQKLKIFRAIHSVQRPTWGEVFFALVVGALAFVAGNKWIYAAALLQMSLADGLAAVVGTVYGNKNQYSLFGNAKSVAGTLTFFLASLLILLGYNAFSGSSVAPLEVVSLSLGAALLENILAKGLDNFVVPLLIALALR